MRVFVQLDVQNLFFSAKDIQKRVDFRRIRDHFSYCDDEVVDMVAYIVRSQQMGRSDKFEAFLKAVGYSLSIKKAIVMTRPGGGNIYTNTDQDIAICIDCMRRIDEFDKWVLMSGDGDFIDLCQYLKKQGKVVEVWSLSGTSFNKRLCDVVDTIHFLGDDFLYEKKDTPRGEDKDEKPRSNLPEIPADTQEDSVRQA